MKSILNVARSQGLRQMVLVTRRAEFSASHFCRNPSLGPEENEKLFGKASRESGHGHNYVLEVTVAGEVDPVDGMIIDLKALKGIIETEVIEPYDHRFLNREVAPFDRVIPTAENIVQEIWRRLEPGIHGNGRSLHSVRLYETPDLYVEYFGEGRPGAW